MGYYTSYTLTASACTVELDSYTTGTISNITRKGIEDEIEKIGVFDKGGDLEFGYFAYDKWYLHDEDMCLLSKRFPDILFCLHGEGEASDDLWEVYYFDGKHQCCPAVITYDDFSPSKLCACKEEINSISGVYSYQSV